MPEKEPWLEELLKVNDETVKMTDKQAKIVQAAVEIFSEKRLLRHVDKRNRAKKRG